MGYRTIPIGKNKELEILSPDDLGVMKWKGEYIKILKEPYSDLDQHGFNQKTILVKCEKCNYKIKTELIQAKCGMCNSYLLRIS